MEGVRTAEEGGGSCRRDDPGLNSGRREVGGRSQALLGAPMAVCSGCAERDGGIGHGKRRSRTGTGASLPGRSVGRMAGQLQTGRQAGSGRARSRARARLNWVSQGQRWGRCRVRRRAERVSRPAREKNRRLRVLVVTICSPRPMRAVQRARCGTSPGRPARRRWRRSGRTACGSTRRRT